jgi:REP element-mobilizing transposase RayT
VPFDPDHHQRRSIRLKGYDYRQPGAYFVTVCAWERLMLFGEVVDGDMKANALGDIVYETWLALPEHYSHVALDSFVVMPNHIHAILMLSNEPVGARLKPAPTTLPATNVPERHGLPEIVRAFKTFSARRINGLRDTPGVPVWQRNYHEHVIRDELEQDEIRSYISTNPARWLSDNENVANSPRPNA